MPANVETAVYSNTPAWHREGVVLDSEGQKGLTIEQALPASGLDWTVRKVPAVAPVEYKTVKGQLVPKANSPLAPVPGRFNIQRESDMLFLGNVGSTWQPVQNVEGFALIDDLIDQASAGQGHAYIEAAGALDGGRKVWVLVHIENGWQIAGEAYNQYVLFTNGHDGRTSVTAATTNVRVVCQNTLAMALQGAQRVVRVRHTSKATDRIKEAAHILGLRNQYAEQLAVQGEFLAEQDMGEGEFEKFLEQLMPVKDERETSPALTMATERRDAVREIYMSAPNLTDIRGTRWAALQAAVEYSDHGRAFRSGETELKNQFGIGTGTGLKDRAFEILKRPDLVLA